MSRVFASFFGGSSYSSIWALPMLWGTVLDRFTMNLLHNNPSLMLSKIRICITSLICGYGGDFFQRPKQNDGLLVLNLFIKQAPPTKLTTRSFFDWSRCSFFRQHSLQFSQDNIHSMLSSQPSIHPHKYDDLPRGGRETSITQNLVIPTELVIPSVHTWRGTKIRPQ